MIAKNGETLQILGNCKFLKGESEINQEFEKNVLDSCKVLI